MATNVRLLGIAGSLRASSYNRAILSAVMNLLPTGISMELLDLGTIPLYNSDIEIPGTPESVRRFREQIAAADALLIATPEYNCSVSGVLKNALDWGSRPYGRAALNGKRVAILGVTTGGSGTANAQRHLREICGAMDMIIVETPQVLISHAATKFDAEGQIVDAETMAQICDLVRNLMGVVTGADEAE